MNEKDVKTRYMGEGGACQCATCKEVRGEVGEVRTFASGATRDVDTDKLDFEAFISPLVTKRYAQFMHANRRQKDGTLRDGDNWTKGITKEAYAKSLTRHVEDFKLHHRGFGDEAVDPDIETTLSAIIFNASGYLFELLKAKRLRDDK